MSTGLYTHRTRNAGEIVTDVLYNTAHKNQQLNDVPNQCGAVSDDLTEYQTVVDPYPGAVALPVVSVAEEIEQYRFAVYDIKTALNGGTPLAFWYTPVTVAPTLAPGRGARVYRSTDQSIPSNTLTACTFDTVRYDTGATSPGIDPFFVLGSPTRLTATAAGLYQILGFLTWNAGAAGQLAVIIRLNGTKTLAHFQYNQAGLVDSHQPVTTQYVLALNDYVELLVAQGTLANPLDVQVPEFGLELLNPTAVIAPPATFPLAITESGTGTGTVTSDVGGIACPGVCGASYAPSTVVTLTATPTTGGFVQWSGDVPGGDEFNNPLLLTMDQARTVDALFTAFTLSITEAGTGSGVVTSDIGGINCPGTCDAPFAPGDIVQLTATPTAGEFDGWTGDLTSSSNPDSITMDADKNVTASFALTGAFIGAAADTVFGGVKYFAPTASVMVNSPTLSDTQVLMPCDIEIVNIAVTMGVAVGGGHTLAAQFNVNGVDNAGIVASLVAADVDKFATGSVTITAGDLLSVKVTQAGGGTDTVHGISFAYRLL